MAKKKSSKKEDSGMNKAMGILKEAFSNMLFSKIVEWFKETVHDIQDAVYLTARKVLESALAMVLMVFGIAMVVFAVPFLLGEYLDLPVSLFFMIIGLILIIISVVSFDHINKGKYKKFKEE